jgi:hypothetical protein
MEAGHPALIIFDEAHLLKPAVLEELRLLSNLTRDGEPLVQIFLVGQPELEKRLLKNRSLRQRITVRYCIKPLTREETKSYIAHRLRAAGCSRPHKIFPDGPMEAVHRLAGGLPREINVIAGYAMLNCFLNDANQVTCEHVRSVETASSFEGVADKEESPDSDSKVVEPLEITTESETPAGERLLESHDETVAPVPKDIVAAPDLVERLGLDRWSGKAVVSVASIVILAFVAIGLMWDDRPEADEKIVESPPSYAGVVPDAPDRESLEAKSEPVSDEAEAPLPVIKVDRVLADEPNRLVTIQIASLDDQEGAEKSLAEARAQTNMPGALQTVPAGDKTWHLVLLGCFRNVKEAENALKPVLPALGSQSVTEVRIKPAPRWLQKRLTKSP